jgi:hypothetical protein
MQARPAARTALLLVSGLISAGCGGRDFGPPVALYGGAPRTSSEVSVIEVVRSRSGGDHPTILVRRITRLGTEPQVLFEAESASDWAIPGHFGGPPEIRRGGGPGEARNLPDRFQVLPGAYQLDFLYAPSLDRWGWKHVSTEESRTRLECRPGYVYRLEGGFRGEARGWTLSTQEVRAGGG